MKNRFNLNESEKNKIRGLHGIKPINEQTSMGPFVEDKSDMVTCAEQNYDIPPLTINMAGTIADRIMQSAFADKYMEEGGIDESKAYSVWMGAFMDNLVRDKRIDLKLLEDIVNSTGCMYDLMKKFPDLLEVIVENAKKILPKEDIVNEDAGRDTPGGNPDFFYGDGSLDKLRKFAEEQDSEMSKEDIVNELIGIYSYSQDGATDLVNTALETLITNLGGFKE